MKLGIVIPAKNEAENIQQTLKDLIDNCAARIQAEVIVVNDGSTDDTVNRTLDVSYPLLRVFTPTRRGFGRAIRIGINYALEANVDAIAIFMADGSDSADDLKYCYETMVSRGSDCVFGSRFIHHGGWGHENIGAIGYPKLKLLINRAGNRLIQWLWTAKSNDTTNAFKLYKTAMVRRCLPLLSRDFAILVELPLKCLNRHAAVDVVPITWRGRQNGRSKFRLLELTWRYLVTLLWVYLEHVLWD